MRAIDLIDELSEYDTDLPISIHIEREGKVAKLDLTDCLLIQTDGEIRICLELED